MSQVKHVKECIHDEITTDCAPIISERSLSSSLCHECVIENYSTLKEKTYYSMTHEEDFLQRTLKLYKTKTSHNFQFHCELTNSDIKKMSDWQLVDIMECYIAYDEDEVICPGNLNETNYGFSIEIPNEIITDPGNKYLHENDKLVIQFRYRNYFYTRDLICRSGTTAKEDEGRLSEDLLSLYEREISSDFDLFDEDGVQCYVHKAICRSRCENIDDIDDENVTGFTTKGKSHHLDTVIRYIYSGILPQLSVDDLLKVVVIVETLDVPRLRMSIQQALLEILNKNNAVKIRTTCLNYSNMHRVAAAAEELLIPVRTSKKRRGRK